MEFARAEGPLAHNPLKKKGKGSPTNPQLSIFSSSAATNNSFHE